MPRDNPESYNGVIVELSEIFTIDEKLDEIADILRTVYGLDSDYVQPPNGGTGDQTPFSSDFITDKDEIMIDGSQTTVSLHEDIHALRKLLEGDHFSSKPFEIKDKQITSEDNPYELDFEDESSLGGEARYMKLYSTQPFVINRRIDNQWFEYPWQIAKETNVIISETIERIEIDFQTVPTTFKMSASQIPEALRA